MERGSEQLQLQQQGLFELFRLQLKKDFEGAGLDAGFCEHIPQEWSILKNVLQEQLTRAGKMGGRELENLLYRIDVSEEQIKRYSKLNPSISFLELVSELVIKRVLQKVVIRKNFPQK